MVQRDSQNVPRESDWLASVQSRTSQDSFDDSLEQVDVEKLLHDFTYSQKNEMLNTRILYTKQQRYSSQVGQNLAVSRDKA